MSFFTEHYYFDEPSFETINLQIAAGDCLVNISVEADKTLIIEEKYNNISLVECISMIAKDEDIDWMLTCGHELSSNILKRLVVIKDNTLVAFLGSCGIGDYSNYEWGCITENPGFKSLAPYAKSGIFWCNYPFEFESISLSKFGVIDEYIFYKPMRPEPTRRLYLALLELPSELGIGNIVSDYLLYEDLDELEFEDEWNSGIIEW